MQNQSLTPLLSTTNAKANAGLATESMHNHSQSPPVSINVYFNSTRWYSFAAIANDNSASTIANANANNSWKSVVNP
jgi:hypothetical protein